MKAIKIFLTVAIALAAATLADAQDKTDSIKVYYEPANPVHHGDNLEYYVDSVLLKIGFIETFNPTQIEKIDIVKNKVYITLKKDVPYNFVSLQSLSNKYLKTRENKGVLYTVDGKLITDAETWINEKNILSISVAADQKVSALPGGKATIFKILTRSKENIENANKIYIRGNTLGSR
ncbi:hypothetical protein [Pedobacter ginsengisoli]|uniref:hypothetical protein n=1 Tax=Pedobacter ginsengisoli TaxID=363852 RepID=UPI00254BB94D|nr:hypothetical protein [Pedobacter ginsengisoli]